jgi:phospholipase C
MAGKVESWLYKKGSWLIGDVNGDGQAEICQQWNNNGKLGMTVSGWQNNAMSKLWFSSNMGQGPSAVSWLIGDVNGDGQAEICQQWNNSGKLGMIVYGWKNNAMSKLWSSSNMGQGPGAVSWLIGDVNGDGKAEICQQWNNNGTLGMIVYGWKNNAMSALWSSSNMHQTSAAVSWLIGDVNGDGKAEICQQVNNNGALTMIVYGWQKNNNSMSALSSSSYMGQTSAAVSWLIGDVNGDGKAEICQQVNNNRALGMIVYGWQKLAMGVLWSSSNMGQASAAVSWLIGDVNGDGQAEICQQRSNFGALEMIVYGWQSNNNKMNVLWSSEPANMHQPSGAVSWLIGDVTGAVNGDYKKAEICQQRTSDAPLSTVVYGWQNNVMSVLWASKITNVFVLMLENRSFDHMFAMSGIPGITAATTSDSNSIGSTRYYVQDGAPTVMPSDPGHEFPDVVEQLCGAGVTYTAPYPKINNSGFAANYSAPSVPPPPPSSAIGDIMACFDTKNQLPVVYQLATEFALCDHWYSSMPGPTWPNRFFVHGASSSGLDHSPSRYEMLIWETRSGFVYQNGSIYDALNKAGIRWRLYNDFDNAYTNAPPSGALGQAGRIPIVAALKNISIRDVHSLCRFTTDLKGDYPYAYTFIEPNYGDARDYYTGGSSQHPQDDVYGGEGLIKAVYEAIRNSPLWYTSLLIITYDEHGGFYDSVAPPGNISAPNDVPPTNYNEYGFGFTQYGVRVPAIVVSPYIPQGTVNQAAYDHTSVLATLEKLWGIGPLTDRDRNANNVTGLLSLSTPRTTCPKTLNDPAAPAPKVPPTPEALAASNAQRLPQEGNIWGTLAVARRTGHEIESVLGPAALPHPAASSGDLETWGDARAYIEWVVRHIPALKDRLEELEFEDRLEELERIPH